LHRDLESSPIAARVPELLGFEETASEACLVESFLGGFPLSSRSASPRDDAIALEWLLGFREALSSTPGPIARFEIEAALRLAVPFLEDEAAQRRLAERLAPLLTVPVPRALVHGDFNPHNVHRDPADGGLFVVDWEDARENEPVTEDVFHYEAVAAFIGRPLDPMLVRSVLARLSVPAEMEEPLRLYYLARSPHRHSARDGRATGEESVERWVRLLRLALAPETAPRGIHVA
jgi:hypothetical protein